MSVLHHTCGVVLPSPFFPSVYGRKYTSWREEGVPPPFEGRGFDSDSDSLPGEWSETRPGTGDKVVSCRRLIGWERFPRRRV